MEDGKKENEMNNTKVYSYVCKQELKTTSVLISVCGHVVIAVIYFFYLTLLVPHFLCPKQESQ